MLKFGNAFNTFSSLIDHMRADQRTRKQWTGWKWLVCPRRADHFGCGKEAEG